jgi:hypothetical protein
VLTVLIVVKEITLVAVAVTMPTLFDRLPMDVIQYEIAPYLSNDYEARIILNQQVPPVERFSRPLNPDARIGVGMLLAIANLRPYSYPFKDPFYQLRTTLEERTNAMIKCYKLVRIHAMLFQYNRKMRDVILEKLRIYSDPSYADLSNLDPALKNEVITAASRALATIEGHFPYIREVSVKFDPSSRSPAGLTPDIVDNSKYLAQATVAAAAARIAAEAAAARQRLQKSKLVRGPRGALMMKRQRNSKPV